MRASRSCMVMVAQRAQAPFSRFLTRTKYRAGSTSKLLAVVVTDDGELFPTARPARWAQGITCSIRGRCSCKLYLPGCVLRSRAGLAQNRLPLRFRFYFHFLAGGAG